MVAILAAAGTSLSAMDEVPELLGRRGGGPWTPEHRNMVGGEKLVHGYDASGGGRTEEGLEMVEAPLQQPRMQEDKEEVH